MYLGRITCTLARWLSALLYLILTWLDKCQVYALPPHTRITLTLFQIAPAADRIVNTTVGGRGLSACIQNSVRVDHMLGHLFFPPSRTWCCGLRMASRALSE